jgi:hydrogenase small subunit
MRRDCVQTQEIELSVNQAGDAVSRRTFLQVCGAAAAAVGLPAWAGEKMADTVASGKKPSIVWLHFQECTGCTESLLRTSHPDVASLLLDLVSLDYHETLFAAAGEQIEDALEKAKRRGGYVLVVEGAIPRRQGGVFCMVGGKTAVDSLVECAERAAAVVCIGSCASWGGVAAAAPNPTEAVGAAKVLQEKGIAKPVVTLPGCPANPYNLLGTVLQFATFGTLPRLDAKGRPAFAYARTIHEDCPRRPHFDAGRFAQVFGDAGHREGFCLYRLGCKGPQTHANCSLLPFCEVPGAWPIGIGHPCFGCTEEGIGFHVPIYENLPIDAPTAPMAYPAIHPEHGVVGRSAVAVGVGAAIVGALAGAGVAVSRKLSRESRDEAKREE